MTTAAKSKVCRKCGRRKPVHELERHHVPPRRYRHEPGWYNRTVPLCPRCHDAINAEDDHYVAKSLDEWMTVWKPKAFGLNYRGSQSQKNQYVTSATGNSRKQRRRQKQKSTAHQRRAAYR